jgi:hypothetical protein
VALALVRGTMRSQSTERRAAPWWVRLWTGQSDEGFAVTCTKVLEQRPRGVEGAVLGRALNLLSAKLRRFTVN